VGDAVKDAMKALGCSLVTVEGSGAHTLSCVRYPAGVGAADFLPKVVKRGVSLAGGLHKDIKTQYFRIGHMGPSTRRLDHVIKTVQAIEDAFAECGHKIPEKGKAAKIIKALAKKDIRIKPCSSTEKIYHGCPVPARCQVYTVATLAAAVAAGFLLASFKK
jgi:alanine-glyoxylate transaminase / serine-glyoxylate transaminase / serine-pyruvate transaminase